MTQDQALAILKTGASVFLTGEPGSGKSYTVNQYVAFLRSKGIEPAITASTGIAATHIGGVTIHSWSGIGIKNSLTKTELNFLLDNKRLVSRIKKTSVLIIDEISMLSSQTFTVVELVCRTLRQSELAFGGLQVVLVGDFFQLPPIVRRGAEPQQLEIQDLDPEMEDDGTPFAFRSAAWRTLDPTVCYLEEQHRQDSSQFLDALSAVRKGLVTEDVRAFFTGRLPTTETVVPEKTTKLFPHNANVDMLNDVELKKLPDDAMSFTMSSRGAPPLIESLKRSCLSPEVLVLKIGAKVLFTKNNPELRYVNGTTGEVIGFNPENKQPRVQIKGGRTIEVTEAEWAISDGERVVAAISQLPLRLAWAITVHKSQGMSLDAAVIDLRSAFEYGQGYVALSRVRSLDGLYLLGFNTKALEVHPAVLQQDAFFRGQSRHAEGHFAAIGPIKLEALQKEFIASCVKDPIILTPTKPPKGATYEVTRSMLIEGKLSIAQIAENRAITPGTVISHIEKLIDEGVVSAEQDLPKLKPAAKKFEAIKKALFIVRAREGEMYLSQTREILGDAYTFDEIRLTRLFL